MKKIILIILLVALIATLMVSVCFATDRENEISNTIKTYDKITDARCVIYENNCVVAIKTEKFTSQSEYETFKTSLEKEICDKYNLEHLIITRSPKAMHGIKAISQLSDEERTDAIKKFVEFHLSPKPHRPHVHPR